MDLALGLLYFLAYVYKLENINLVIFMTMLVYRHLIQCCIILCVQVVGIYIVHTRGYIYISKIAPNCCILP